VTPRDRVIETLRGLGESELRKVADYVAFLKYQAQRKAVATFDAVQVATLYAEFAEEDRRLAEEGMDDYVEQLAAEDAHYYS
jgi:hypothetical protein